MFEGFAPMWILIYATTDVGESYAFSAVEVFDSWDPMVTNFDDMRFSSPCSRFSDFSSEVGVVALEGWGMHIRAWAQGGQPPSDDVDMIGQYMDVNSAECLKGLDIEVTSTKTPLFPSERARLLFTEIGSDYDNSCDNTTSLVNAAVATEITSAPAPAPGVPDITVSGFSCPNGYSMTPANRTPYLIHRTPPTDPPPLLEASFTVFLTIQIFSSSS